MATTEELLKEKIAELEEQLARERTENRRLRQKVDEKTVGAAMTIDETVTYAERLIKAKPVAVKEK